MGPLLVGWVCIIILVKIVEKRNDKKNADGINVVIEFDVLKDNGNITNKYHIFSSECDNQKKLYNYVVSWLKENYTKDSKKSRVEELEDGSLELYVEYPSYRIMRKGMKNAGGKYNYEIARNLPAYLEEHNFYIHKVVFHENQKTFRTRVQEVYAALFMLIPLMLIYGYGLRMTGILYAVVCFIIICLYDRPAGFKSIRM